jgi:hypothetical protein
MQCNVIYRGDRPARRKGRKVLLVAAAHGEAVLGKLLRQQVTYCAEVRGGIMHHASCIVPGRRRRRSASAVQVQAQAQAWASGLLELEPPLVPRP